jgi:antitoxin component YwqK of YwqJK toxin-antitoxin module
VYYENGLIEFKGSLKNEKMNGLWEGFYDTKDKIKWRRNYKNGEEIGEEKHYFEDGKLNIDAIHPNGRYIEYYEDGQIDLNGQLKNNEKDGLWTWYDGYNGAIFMTKEYKNGLLHGVSHDMRYSTKSIYENNELVQEERFNDNGKHHYIKKHVGDNIQFTYYHTNGNIKLKGKLNENKQYYGKIKEYNKNGILEKQTDYKNGSRDGLMKKYYENGKVSYQREYKDNLHIGKSISYYPNGKIRSESMSDGFKAYNVKNYDEQGNLESTNN